MVHLYSHTPQIKYHSPNAAHTTELVFGLATYFHYIEVLVTL